MGEMSEEYLTNLNRLIAKGDPNDVERYITEKKITPDSYYDYFMSNFVENRLGAVGMAAKCGNVKVMKVLLEFGFLVDELQPTLNQARPIHKACEVGSVAVVKLLVEEYGVDITNIHNCESRSAMFIAAELGHVEIVRYFLDKGISVDLRFGAYLRSVLHSAAENGQDEACKLLLSKGADVNLRDKFQNTPLMFSVRNKYFSSVQVLLAFGSNVNAVNTSGQTAFYLAAEKGSIDIMKLLHSHGADPEFCDTAWRSPLHIAVELNHSPIIFYLVNELNVVLNPPEYYTEDWTAGSVCSMAIRQGSYDVVRLLYNAGYDPSVEYDGNYDEDAERNQHYRSLITPVRFKDIKEMISRPRSLLALCVLTVRRVLGRRLPVDLYHLPLPEILKKKIVTGGDKKTA